MWRLGSVAKFSSEQESRLLEDSGTLALYMDNGPDITTLDIGYRTLGSLS